MQSSGRFFWATRYNIQPHIKPSIYAVKLNYKLNSNQTEKKLKLKQN